MESVTSQLECQRCGHRAATRNRQRTAYNDDALNWATLCPTCQEREDEYWDERWEDYYQSR